LFWRRRRYKKTYTRQTGGNNTPSLLLFCMMTAPEDSTSKEKAVEDFTPFVGKWVRFASKTVEPDCYFDGLLNEVRVDEGIIVVEKLVKRTPERTIRCMEQLISVKIDDIVSLKEMPRLFFLTSQIEDGDGYSYWSHNGLGERLRRVWKPNSKMMFIPSQPGAPEINDSWAHAFITEIFPNEGMTIECVKVVDKRNPRDVDLIEEMDVVFLGPGYPFVMNPFLQDIHLKEKLQKFRGIVIGWSAGSMNCSDFLLDRKIPDKKHPGLSIIREGISPHFHLPVPPMVINHVLIEESKLHDVIGMPNGSYIVVEGETETLFGEAYLIRDGKCEQICRDDESIVLKSPESK